MLKMSDCIKEINSCCNANRVSQFEEYDYERGCGLSIRQSAHLNKGFNAAQCTVTVEVAR